MLHLLLVSICLLMVDLQLNEFSRLAQDKDCWALAGDLDLSDENLEPGTGFPIGPCVIEVIALPYTGCKTLYPD